LSCFDNHNHRRHRRRLPLLLRLCSDTNSDMSSDAARAMCTLISASASASLLATPKPIHASGSFPTPTSCASTQRPRQMYSRSLPVQHDPTTPRARARAARLRANEAAERREDLAALITTPVRELVHPSTHSDLHPTSPRSSWTDTGLPAHRHNGRYYAALSQASRRSSLILTGCRGTCLCPSSQHQHRQ
jgi:hypothetical protein